jgi:hypothetical protein
LYKVLYINTDADPDIINTYSAGLERAREDGRDWAPHVRRLDLVQVAPTHKAELERLMHQFPRIESLMLDTAVEQGPWLPACSRIYTDSLAHLTMIEAGATEYLHVGAFRALRALYIMARRTEFDGEADGWALPALETLEWWEVSPSDMDPGGVGTVRFLARCRFPHLHTAELVIEIRPQGGVECLHRFLSAHPGMQHLTLVLWPAQYAMVLPAVRAEHLNIQYFGELEPSLVHYLPPTVVRLDLPVFLYERRPELARSTSTLAQLAATPRGVREVHLAVAERWGEDHMDINSVMSLMTEFNLHSSANSHPVRRKELLEVRDIALRLWERGVVVYDESGLAFKDHDLECESDPGSDVAEAEPANNDSEEETDTDGAGSGGLDADMDE